jgi:hypothetical protein
MISAFSWERTITVERHREGTTLQVAEDFSLCHSERSLRSEESLFSWVCGAALWCDAEGHDFSSAVNSAKIDVALAAEA